ncbi:MAG TPA: type II toxin-antitoxin system PemK/MazF family toxin [Anaerolineales bacterium]|nr:type II toxin-antitoxin system PemK/MazF family toxin [Anaerolineales bacterium]
MKARPGEIWLADLGLAAKVRPVLIVSRQDPHPPCALLTYVPVTTQQRGSAYEVPVGHLSFLDAASVLNVQGIGSLVEPRLERKLGHVSADVMAKVKDALRFALDL